ncbi:MAG: lipopolysaccharide biosynthesis protein [Pirellulaceae bacterium]
MSRTLTTTRKSLMDWYTRARSKTAARASLAIFDQAIISGISFVTSVVVGRLAGQAELGVYALGMSVVLLAISVQQSLISAPHTIFVIRQQKGRERQEYNGSTLVQFFALNATIIVALGVIAGVLLAGVGSQDRATLLLLLLLVCPAVLIREFGRRFLFADFRVGSALILDASIAVLQLGLLWLLVVSEWLTGRTALIAVALACAVSGVVWLVASWPAFQVSRGKILPEVRRNWGFGRWIFGGQVSVALVMVMLNWMLAGFKGDAATGAFGACMMLILLANPFILGIQNILSPKMAEAMHEGGRSDVRRMVFASTLVLASVMAVYTLLVAVFGDWVIQFIYGDEFAGNQTTIRLLAAGAFALAVGVSANHGLRALERPEINFYATATGLLVATTCAVLLIPEWGPAGAAAGYLVGCTITAIIRFAGLLHVSAAPKGDVA